MKKDLAQQNVILDVEVITFLALLIGLALYGFWRRLRPQPVEPAPEKRFEKIDLILIWVPAWLFLVMPLLRAIPSVAEANQKAAEKTITPDQEIITSLYNIGFFGFVAILVYAILKWIRDFDVVTLMGVRRLSLPYIVVLSILIGLGGYVVSVVLVGPIANEYLISVFGELELQDPVKELKGSGTKTALCLKIVTAVAAAAIGEEVLFRGYIYPVIKQYTSTAFSVVIVSALFTCAHGNLNALLPLFAFGIVLALSYEFTKCIWVPIGVHAVFNATNIVAMLQVSSQ